MIAWGCPGPKGGPAVPAPGARGRRRSATRRRADVETMPTRRATGVKPRDPDPRLRGPRRHARLPAGRAAGAHRGRQPRSTPELRRRRQVRQLPPQGSGGVSDVRPCSRDATRHAPDGARQLRPGDGLAPRRDLDVLPPRREVPGPHRRSGRQACRVRDRLHLRRRSSPAVPGALPRRTAPVARAGLGHAAPQRRRAALVSPLPRRDAPASRPASLDRARADVELPVRRVPLDEPPEGVRSRREPLHDDLGRAHRVLRGVPRTRLGPRGVGRGASGRSAPGTGRLDGARRAPRGGRRGVDRQGHRARHRRMDRTPTARRGSRRLRALPCAAATDRRSPPVRATVPRHPRARAPRARPLPRRWANPRRGLRVGLLRPEPHAPRRGDLLGLPRAPSGRASRPRQRRMRPVSPPDPVRHAGPPSPSPRLRGGALRELSHAVAHPHGGGPASGSQLPGAAPRSLRHPRHAERVHGLSRDSTAPVGRRPGPGVGRSRPIRARRGSRPPSTPRAADFPRRVPR